MPFQVIRHKNTYATISYIQSKDLYHYIIRIIQLKLYQHFSGEVEIVSSHYLLNLDLYYNYIHGWIRL